MTSEYRSMRAQLPAQVEDLVAAIRNPLMQIEFLSRLHDARLLEPVLVDAETAARMMWEARYQRSDGIPLTNWDARDAAYDTHIALIRLGALIQVRHGLDPEQATRDGATFARAALRTWPA